MIKILEECARFKAISHILSDQARMIIKKMFYQTKILEIYEQIDKEIC